MTEPRLFSVRPIDEGAAHRIEGSSFEAAALAFVDCWHPAADTQGDVAVVVIDETSGHQQCFRIDLDSGEAQPCD